MRRLLLSLLSLLLLASCGTETRLAKRFVQQSKNVRIAIYFPETALVSDARRIDSTYTYPLIDSLNSDLFLDIMYSSYSEELKKYNLDIYRPDDPDNIQVDSLHWLAMLTQVSIEESTIEYMDYGYGPRDYRYYYPLKCINVASWFDFNNGEWSNTQFHELNLTDGFSSEASYRHSTFNYSYQIDTLHIANVYNFAVFLGKVYAAYTYDFFMNDFIATEMRRMSLKPNGKLRYDPSDNKFYYYSKEEGFYELENDNGTAITNQEPQ